MNIFSHTQGPGDDPPPTHSCLLASQIFSGLDTPTRIHMHTHRTNPGISRMFLELQTRSQRMNQ